jgi:DNA-binding MarR family transcriptional regulator
VTSWSFLTNHARVLLIVAKAPDALLRSIAAELGVTERTAFGVIADLIEAGYLVKHKDGRRNRYAIQTHLPLPDDIVADLTIGEVLRLLTSIAEY